MKAIMTKVLPPVGKLGRRYKAYDCDKNQLTIEDDDRLPPEANHLIAAHALAEKMDWLRGYTLHPGFWGDRWVWVFVKDTQ